MCILYKVLGERMSVEFIRRLIDEYSREVDFVDVRLQRNRGLILGTENGSLRRVQSFAGEGLGIRLLKDGCWGIGSTDILDKSSIEGAFKRAFSMVNVLASRSPSKLALSEEKIYEDVCEYKVKVPFENVSFEEKKDLIVTSDREMRKTDARIVGSYVNYIEMFIEKVYLSSEGANIIQRIPSVFLMFQAIAREGVNLQSYFDIIGGHYGYEKVEETDVMKIAIDTARKAIEMLKAETIKGGEMVVVMDGRVTGTFAHEVFGHAAEADNVLGAKSFLSGLIGKKIGSDVISIVDDATVPNAYGSYFYDDEGVPAQRKVLLDKGILRGYLHNRETAAKIGVKSTGNGRAQDYARRVYVRMSNTFVAPGDWSFEEMIGDVNYGVYVEGVAGGMEDPVGGGFQVNALRAWLIEKGEFTKLLKAVSISGRALDILKNVDAVGKELTLEPGSCGKGYAGDMVPVTTGGPPIRVRKMVVGLAR